MNVLLQHGFSPFGEHVSYAEFVGQLGALAVVFLAQRRTLWTARKATQDRRQAVPTN